MCEITAGVGMVKLRKDLIITVGLSVATCLLLVITILTYFRTDQFISNSRWVDHTYTVLLQIDKVMSILKDAETGQRGYLLTNDETFLAPYRNAVSELPQQLQTLLRLTEDNQQQHDTILNFRNMVYQKLELLQQGIAMQGKLHQGVNQEVLDILTTGKKTMDEIRANTIKISETEISLLDQRAKTAEENAKSTKRWIIFANLFALTFIFISFGVLRREMKTRIKAQLHAEKVASQLEVTNRELESFSYSVSHDLRSPLRAIDGYSRIFEEDYASTLDSEGLRLLGVVRQNSRRMGKLIDDLLDFARSGRKSMELERIDMEQLVQEVWADIVEDTETELQLNTKGLIPVWADRALIRQVLMNLLSNAVKYSSSRDQPRVEIHSMRRNGDVVYEITDNGVGFDMKYYNKLFGVFQRLHTTDEFPGTGVGLAIVQRIVVRHGGHVWAESQLGIGSKFSFSLPTGED